jgi:SAM-dependent methyltransferase
MAQARTEDVKRLYETYPYPFSVGNSTPDFLHAFPLRGYFYANPLAGWRILDAGCGTGHKLVGLAMTYPRARFVGIELSAASVAVARGLVKEYGLSNVEVRQGNLLDLAADEKYDFIQSVGVIHHLEDPQKGLNNLCNALAENGILAFWLYHPLGEFERFLRRELLLTLWGGHWQDMAEGQALMEQLGLDLELKHYGTRDREANVLEGNADAFMHPIVNGYRFAEALVMLRGAGMDWAAFDYVNMKGEVKLLNLSEVHDPVVSSSCLQVADLFTAIGLQERYGRLAPEDKLKVIELSLRPRGFQVLTGKATCYERLGARARGNVIAL